MTTHLKQVTLALFTTTMQKKPLSIKSLMNKKRLTSFLNASDKPQHIELDFIIDGRCLLNDHIISNQSFDLKPYGALIIKTDSQ